MNRTRSSDACISAKIQKLLQKNCFCKIKASKKLRSHVYLQDDGDLFSLFLSSKKMGQGQSCQYENVVVVVLYSVNHFKLQRWEV